MEQNPIHNHFSAKNNWIFYKEICLVHALLLHFSHQYQKRLQQMFDSQIILHPFQRSKNENRQFNDMIINFEARSLATFMKMKAFADQEPTSNRPFTMTDPLSHKVLQEVFELKMNTENKDVLVNCLSEFTR